MNANQLSPNFSRASLLHPRLVVSSGTSEYGHAEPQIEIVELPNGTHFRTINSLVHQLAASIELKTQSLNDEHWIVQTDLRNARVYLELAVADAAESDRAIAMLEDLIGLFT